MELIASDTETGGIHPAIHALLSIGACCSWSDECFEVYITVESQPGKTVDPEAAQKNGYTPERWLEMGAVDLATAMQSFDRWLKARKEERRKAKMVCHHLAFDKGFLGEAGRVTGVEMPHRHDWRCSQLKFGELMDEDVIPRGSSALDRLKELSGWTLPRAEAHNALQDARITLHGYLWLKERDKDAERTFSELAGMRLQEIRLFDDAMGQLSVWYENGLEGGRSLTHMLEEMTCLAKSFYDDDTGAKPRPLSGMRRMLMERVRQIWVEGWTPEGDASYPAGVLEAAAECYLWELRARKERGEVLKSPPPAWPWAKEWWKPTEDPLTQIVKAAALCAAAIDRLEATKKEGSDHGA